MKNDVIGPIEVIDFQAANTLCTPEGDKDGSTLATKKSPGICDVVVIVQLLYIGNAEEAPRSQQCWQSRLKYVNSIIQE